MIGRVLRTAVVLAGLALVACGGDSDGGDIASFCEAVDDLADNDPFAELEIASPEEMRAAFDRLHDGVERIDDSAPSELESRTHRYLEAVDEVIDQLRGAGFDPRNLDTLAYRTATADHEAAAVSIENAATAACA